MKRPRPIPLGFKLLELNVLKALPSFPITSALIPIPLSVMVNFNRE